MHLLALPLIVASLSASACPDLAGTYATCRSTMGSASNSHDMSIIQSSRRGVTTYSIKMTYDESGEPGSETIMSDGKPHSEIADSDEGQVIYTSTARCEGNALINDVVIKMDGIEIAGMEMKYTKSGNTLTNETKGHLFGFPSQDTLICE